MGKNPEAKYIMAEPKFVEFHAMGTGVWFFQLFILNLSFLMLCIFPGCESGKKMEPAPMSAEEKIADLNKQLNTKFENPDVHYKLGQLYQEQGNWDKAEYHYNVALGFDPSYRAVQAAMVKGLMSNGYKAKAEQFASAYMSQASASGSALACLQLAEAFNKQQLDNYTLACYQQALRLGPNSPEVNKQIGLYYLGKKDKERAKEYLSKSFQLNPNQPDVSGELGRLGVAVKIPEKK
jgi:tetratricopeptide (TPR) repeat protein